MREEENIYPDFGSDRPPPLLGDEDLKIRLKGELASWKLIKTPLPDNLYKDRKELYKQFSFDSFGSVVDFLNELKPVCDMIPHHPRFENVYATLEIYLSTWAKEYDITFKDIILAKNIDRIYQEKYEMVPHVNALEAKENGQFFIGLKDEVAADGLNAAITKLDAFFNLNPGRERPNEFILLKGDHVSYINSVVAGNLSKEESDLKRNQLGHRLLALVDLLMNDVG